MPNPISLVFALIITVGSLVTFPLYMLLDRHEDQAQIIARSTTTTFVDSVRNKGYITPAMYDEFYMTLHSSGYTFDVEVEHQAKVYHPIYTDPANLSTFTGDYQVDYEHYYTAQILPILFPNNTLTLEDDSRRYTMMIGDFFHVKVTNQGKTPVTMLREAITNDNEGNANSISIIYGGMIHNEDY